MAPSGVFVCRESLASFCCFARSLLKAVRSLSLGARTLGARIRGRGGEQNSKVDGLTVSDYSTMVAAIVPTYSSPLLWCPVASCHASHRCAMCTAAQRSVYSAVAPGADLSASGSSMGRVAVSVASLTPSLTAPSAAQPHAS